MKHLILLIIFVLVFWAVPAIAGQGQGTRKPVLESQETGEQKLEQVNQDRAGQDPGKNINIQGKEEFESQVSYALGKDIFRHISQYMELDLSSFVRGMEDYKNNELKMDEDKLRNLLMAFQRLARQKEAEKIKTASQANKARGKIFLEGNKLKQGVVTRSSGLQYKILVPGDGPVPSLEDTVECHYKGTLLDGKVFDSSFARGKPAVFQISNVIRGWKEALQLMPVGSKWKLFIPADLAYGEQGAGQEIGPGQTLVFEVQLLGIIKSE